MSKKKTERLFDEISEVTKAITEGDEALTVEEVRADLCATGVDPDDLRARFHERVKQLAERERLANRTVPQSLKRAIDSTQPTEQLPNDPIKATEFANQWLEKFSSAFVLPPTLESARAYRALDDLSAPDQKALDELEEELKDKVKKENEPQS